MKTKFKSILAVTLAATTFFSCSNEIEAPDNAQMLNPGDVQISIGLGNGTTTYSTIEAEKAFKNGSGKLFGKDGVEIPMKDAAIKSDVAGGALKFTAIVEAGKFTEGSDANLYLYVNGTPVAAGVDEAAFKKATVSTVLDRVLTNGLPAGFGPSSVTLKGGVIASGTAALKRAASRVGAKFTGSFAAGYTVALNKVNLTSGALFEEPVAADGTGTVSARTLDGLNLDNMYKKTETVAYVYPSSNKSEVVVTPPAGMGAAKTINFAPTAGKNYTINITPATGSDASLNWAVTITEWDPTDENIDADFGATAVLNLKGLTLPTGSGMSVSPDGKSILLDAYSDFQLTAATVSLTGLAIGSDAIKSVDKVIASSGSAPSFLKVVANGNNIEVKAVPNTTGAPIKETVTVSGIQDNGTPFSSKFMVELPSIERTSLDAMKAATVKMGDVEFVMFGTSGNLKTDYAKAVELAGLGGFNEAAIIAATAKYIGSVGARKACPVGYKVPTLADYTDNLFGGSTRNYMGITGGPKWASALNTPLTLGTANDVTVTAFLSETVVPNQKSAFKVERAGKTYYMAGNSNYWTTTDGTVVAGTAGHSVRISPWHDGIAFNAALHTASPAGDTSSTRCIVDKDYAGLK